MASVLPTFPGGFDARPVDRPSRASNVLNFLGALSGGQQATFLHDPADKRTGDDGYAQRQSARASAAAVAADTFAPPSITKRIWIPRLSVRESEIAQPSSPSGAMPMPGIKEVCIASSSTTEISSSVAP